jgi:hypothetical protein
MIEEKEKERTNKDNMFLLKNEILNSKDILENNIHIVKYKKHFLSVFMSFDIFIYIYFA